MPTRIPAGARHYRTSLQKLEECVADLSHRDLAFVIQLGDIVDGHGKDVEKSIEDLDRVLPIYNKLPMPKYHVVGNHCLSVDKETLGAKLGLKRFYYDFTVPSAKGWRFVVLDGNDAGYGVIGDEQLKWFRSTLDKAVKAGEKVICFCHFALLKEAAEHHRMAKPEPILEAMDEAGCVAAWFAGHDHAGGYAVREGVPSCDRQRHGRSTGQQRLCPDRASPRQDRGNRLRQGTEPQYAAEGLGIRLGRALECNAVSVRRCETTELGNRYETYT